MQIFQLLLHKLAFPFSIVKQDVELVQPEHFFDDVAPLLAAATHEVRKNVLPKDDRL
jgi:hypothetical protein